MGFGKSICYESLPFVFNFKHSDDGTGGGCSIVLVVSPLVSLMVDQVASLRSRGVSTAIIGCISSLVISLHNNHM